MELSWKLLDFMLINFPISGVETYIFLPPMVSFTISLFTSMAGISGAFLLMPFQVSVLGFTTPSVSSTNLLYNVTGTPGGVYRFTKEGRMAWPLAFIIVAGIIPGVLLGYYLRIKYLPDPKTFKLFVGLVLLYVGIRLLRDVWAKKFKQEGDLRKGDSGIENISMGLVRTRFNFMGTTHSFSSIGMFILAFVIGIVGGIYGIGGGSIIAPFCITVCKLPVYTIAGAVLFGTFVSSVSGVMFYSLIPVSGAVAQPDWALGILFGLGGLLGMYSGAKMQKRVPEKWIKLILGVIVFIVALRYVTQFVG
jgi:uncharacterized membrane protein YfcA